MVRCALCWTLSIASLIGSIKCVDINGKQANIDVNQASIHVHGVPSSVGDPWSLQPLLEDHHNRMSIIGVINPIAMMVLQFSDMKEFIPQKTRSYEFKNSVVGQFLERAFQRCVEVRERPSRSKFITSQKLQTQGSNIQAKSRISVGSLYNWYHVWWFGRSGRHITSRDRPICDKGECNIKSWDDQALGENCGAGAQVANDES